MGRIIISIQSFSDIITNSSSEVFIVNTPSDTVKAVVKDILSVARDNANNGSDRYGGMGGEFEVYTWENGFKMYKHRHIHSRNNPDFTPQMWADEIGVPLEKLMSIIVVDMDWCRDATREYLKSKYNAQDEETYYQNEPFVDFMDAYESYDDKLMYREDFDTDEEYEDYLLNEMDV
jgi:hypothetical protein